MRPNLHTYGPHLSSLLRHNMSYIPVVWSAYGRPHRDTLTVLRSFSKSIARKRNFVSAEVVHQELHASITLETVLGKFGLLGRFRPFRTLWTLNPKFLLGALGPLPPVVSCPPAPCAPFSWAVSPLRRPEVPHRPSRVRCSEGKSEASCLRRRRSTATHAGLLYRHLL